MMDIKALAYGEKEYIAALRRHFHAHPELGRHEVETTKRITEELEKMGIEVMTFSDITGCIGVIRGGQVFNTVPGEILLKGDVRSHRRHGQARPASGRRMARRPGQHRLAGRRVDASP